jgi:lysophospholipase L1-like esterase
MIGRAALVLVLMVALSVGAELALRGYASWRLAERPDHEKILAEQSQLDAYIQYDPYLMYRAIPGVARRYTRFNRLGFRGEEIAVPKPRPALRVAILGGSAVFGWGVRDRETFPTQLADRLGDVEVVNGGLPAYNSTQEVILLQLHLLALEPDLVVVFDGLNDLLNTLVPGWRPHANVLADALRLRYGSGPWYGLLVSKLSQSRLLAHLRGRWGQPAVSGPFAEATEAAAIGVYADNLRTILAALAARGIRAIVVVQPALLWTPKPLSREERQAMDEIRRVREHREAGEELARLHPILLRRARRVAGAFRVPVSDLAEPPWPPETCFIDPMHYSGAGNRLVAERLAPLVRAALARPGARDPATPRGASRDR